MLSEDIRNLKDHFAKYAQAGVTIKPRTMCALLVILETMQLDAEALERQIANPLPARAPTGERDGNVIPFRRSSPSQEGITPQNTDGGAA